MSRTTSDAKENTIKLRINNEQRKHIETQASKKYMSMSEYIRELINSDMKRVFLESRNR